MKQFPKVLAALCFAAGLAPALAEEIEVIRDRWGIAHVYADSEEGGFFGAGYATAEDRMFQMTLKRRQAQGRISEILGPGPEDKFLKSDRLVQTLDLYGKSTLELQVMEGSDRRLLEAYAQGVNAYLKKNLGSLDPLFARHGGEPEPWQAQDSLALWNYWGFKFSPHWQNEVAAKRQLEKTPELVAGEARLDDEAAIVSEAEFKRSNPEAYQRLLEISREGTRDGRGKQSRTQWFDPPFDAPKASHNWVVSPRRSTTGAPLLVGKPQLTVDSPNKGHEIHIHAGRYNVRDRRVRGCNSGLPDARDRGGPCRALDRTRG